MPSPIIHAATGYLVYRAGRSLSPAGAFKPAKSVPPLLLISLVFSLLPDVDAVVGLLANDFGRYHNGATHSLLVGLGVSLLFAVLAWRKEGQHFTIWLLVPFLSYELHLLMDFLTVGRGIMAAWPFSSQRFLSPMALFFGVHWSDGIWSIRHLWTLLTELGLIIVVGALVRLAVTGQSRSRV